MCIYYIWCGENARGEIKKIIKKVGGSTQAAQKPQVFELFDIYLEFCYDIICDYLTATVWLYTFLRIYAGESEENQSYDKL